VKTLPIHLNITGRNVLVIGSGEFAIEKIERLLPYGPDITVVSESPSDGLAALIESNGITQLPEPYRAEHLQGYKIVYSAVEDRAEAERIHRDTRESPVLLNTVDTPEFCDFIMPAVVQGEHFAISISTGGKAAGLSKQLREQLQDSLEQEDDVLELLEQVRAIFQGKYDSFGERRDHLRKILDELRQMEA
jgi:precorrin-2 dehydrogenase/sirohydrochlorin ferrochelatase